MTRLLVQLADIAGDTDGKVRRSQDELVALQAERKEFVEKCADTIGQSLPSGFEIQKLNNLSLLIVTVPNKCDVESTKQSILESCQEVVNIIEDMRIIAVRSSLENKEEKMKFKYSIKTAVGQQFVCITPGDRDESDLNHLERPYILENIIPNHKGETVESVWMVDDEELSAKLAADEDFEEGGRAEVILQYMEEEGRLVSALGTDYDEDDWDEEAGTGKGMTVDDLLPFKCDCGKIFPGKEQCRHTMKCPTCSGEGYEPVTLKDKQGG